MKTLKLCKLYYILYYNLKVILNYDLKTGKLYLSPWNSPMIRLMLTKKKPPTLQFNNTSILQIETLKYKTKALSGNHIKWNFWLVESHNFPQKKHHNCTKQSTASRNRVMGSFLLVHLNDPINVDTMERPPTVSTLTYAPCQVNNEAIKSHTQIYNFDLLVPPNLKTKLYHSEGFIKTG